MRDTRATGRKIYYKNKQTKKSSDDEKLRDFSF